MILKEEKEMCVCESNMWSLLPVKVIKISEIAKVPLDICCS